jgi:alkylation response protein AidB-like acyl-CoA dehydrogenase
VNGRTKIAVDNVISNYIPNPTFEVVARPGALADYFAGNNTEGKSQREIIGKPMRAVDAFRSAEPRLRLLDELGLDAALIQRMLFDAGLMRWGWPERAGGLGGSTVLRAVLGEELTSRAIVHAAAWSMHEVLGPAVIEPGRCRPSARSRRATCPGRRLRSTRS